MASCFLDVTKLFAANKREKEAAATDEDISKSKSKEAEAVAHANQCLDYGTSYHLKILCKQALSLKLSIHSSDIQPNKSMIAKPKSLEEMKYLSKPFGIELNIPSVDFHFKLLSNSWMHSMESKLLYSPKLLGKCDAYDNESVQYWNSKSQAILWRKSILESKKLCKDQKVFLYKEMSSSYAMSLLAFNDFGAINTVTIRTYNSNKKKEIKKGYSCHKSKSKKKTPPNGCKYVNDCSWMGQYLVRKGFIRYGATAYFDSQCKLIGIYVCAYDETYIADLCSDNDWKHAKWIWKCSLFVGIELKHYWMHSRFMKSNAWNVALEECLSPSHSLYRLCKIFNIGTIASNHDCISEFLSANGLFDRLFAFEYNELIRLCNDCIRDFSFVSITDQFRDLRNCSDNVCPFYKEISGYCSITKNLISKYLNLYYLSSKDMHSDMEIKRFWRRLLKELRLDFDSFKQTRSELATLLADLVCNATVFHEICSGGISYFMGADFIGLRVRIPDNKCKQQTQCDVKGYAQCLIYTLRTKYYRRNSVYSQLLLMSDWTSFFLKDKHKNKTSSLWDRYQDDLQLLIGSVFLQNKSRRTACFACDPQMLHCSNFV